MRVSKRVFAYIDGWNLQICISQLRKKELMWVNLPQLCTRFLNPEFEFLRRVYLFTAFNTKLPKETQICQGQLDFQRSLGVEVIEGYFGKLKSYDRIRDTRIKEKESDVSLAIKIAEDSILGLCDKVIIISNDGDFVPALKLSSRYNIDVEIITPPVISANRKLLDSISQKIVHQITTLDLEESVISKY